MDRREILDRIAIHTVFNYYFSFYILFYIYGMFFLTFSWFLLANYFNFICFVVILSSYGYFLLLVKINNRRFLKKCLIKKYGKNKEISTTLIALRTKRCQMGYCFNYIDFYEFYKFHKNEDLKLEEIIDLWFSNSKYYCSEHNLAD